MKKHLILLLLAGFFTLASCSEDDDGDPSGTEKTLVGTWTLINVNPPVYDLSCPESPTITFNADGSTQWTLYDSENDCATINSSGTWENTSGNTYSVSVPEYGEVQGTVTFDGANNFSFNTSFESVPVVLTFSKS